MTRWFDVGNQEIRGVKEVGVSVVLRVSLLEGRIVCLSAPEAADSDASWRRDFDSGKFPENKRKFLSSFKS